MFYGFNFSANIKNFVKIDVNISNELNFSDFLPKCKIHWVTSKAYMNSSLCTGPSVVNTSINIREMKFIP